MKIRDYCLSKAVIVQFAFGSFWLYVLLYILLEYTLRKKGKYDLMIGKCSNH